MSADDDPTAVIRVEPVEGHGWDAIVEHPNGDKTFVRNPNPYDPKGFKLTIPKIALDEAAARANGTWRGSQSPLEGAVDFACDMVFSWWALVLLLWIPFFIAEVFFGA